MTTIPETTLPDQHREISAMLVRARATGHALAGPPEGLPTTLEDAYRLQDLSVSAWDDRIAGWKVGGVPPAYLDRFDEKFLAGPIFADKIRHVEQDGTMAMPVYEGGFAAIEPEFVFRMSDDEAGVRLFIGAEIASSPIPHINDYGPTAVISDFGNNNGLVLGPEIENWREREGPAVVATHINGALIGEKQLADFRENALISLDFIKRLAVARGFALPEGTYISSGAITGVHEAEAGAEATLDFGHFGKFDLVLVNAEKQ